MNGYRTASICIGFPVAFRFDEMDWICSEQLRSAVNKIIYLYILYSFQGCILYRYNGGNCI